MSVSGVTAEGRAGRVGEIALVLVTAALFGALPKPPEAVASLAIFIPVCIGSWLVFLVWRLRTEPALADRWGLRPSAHLGPLTSRLAPLLMVLVVSGAAYAGSTGKELVPAYLWVSLLLYPLWGLVQQWLVQALLVDNVRALTGAGLRWLMLLGAVGFGAIHVQHPVLVVATGAMGGLYVWLFQRWRNLWPLAACHGWLGSLFYPWVLGLNPTASIIELLRG